MRLALIGLAACWSPPAKAPRSTTTTTTATATVAPGEPAPPEYQLPAAIADALATEPLAGHVVVGDDAELMATPAAARKTQSTRKGRALAARVVRDHGDVVELSTAHIADCVPSFDQPYELTVFVRRDQLMPRAKTDVTKVYADGTAVAIDRGAPVEIRSAGLVWRGDLGVLPVPPAADQLAYAVPAIARAAALPTVQGEPMVCDESGPRTMTRWRAERRMIRNIEQAEQIEKRRVEQQAREAERERERIACEAKAKKKKKKPQAKPKTPEDFANLLTEIDTCTTSSIFGSPGGIGLGDSLDAANRAWEDEQLAPYCSIEKPWDSTAKVPAPRLDGKPMPWPETRSREVTQLGSKYRADIGYSCGRVRFAVEESALGRGGRSAMGTGIGSIGTRSAPAQIQVWMPKPGPVTWPDGSPAGRYVGRKLYRTVVEQGGRICVEVPGIGELVCHDKATAKTQMVSPAILAD